MTMENGPEVQFRRSSLCSPNSGGCVEVARTADGALVRDAKDANSPVLRFTEDEWQAFVGGILEGDFR